MGCNYANFFVLATSVVRTKLLAGWGRAPQLALWHQALVHPLYTAACALHWSAEEVLKGELLVGYFTPN